MGLINTVDINNQSTYPLIVNRIDTTKYREGKIVIVDTARLLKDEFVFDSSSSPNKVIQTSFQGELLTVVPAEGAPVDNGAASMIDYTQVGTTNYTNVSSPDIDSITYAPRDGLQYLWVEGQDKTQTTITKYEKKSFNLFGDNALADLLVKDNSWVSQDIVYTDQQPLLESELLAINLTANYAVPDATTTLSSQSVTGGSTIVLSSNNVFYRYIGSNSTENISDALLLDATLWQHEGPASPS